VVADDDFGTESYQMPSVYIHLGVDGAICSLVFVTCSVSEVV